MVEATPPESQNNNQEEQDRPLMVTIKTTEIQRKDATHYIRRQYLQLTDAKTRVTQLINIQPGSTNDVWRISSFEHVPQEGIVAHRINLSQRMKKDLEALHKDLLKKINEVDESVVEGTHGWLMLHTSKNHPTDRKYLSSIILKELANFGMDCLEVSEGDDDDFLRRLGQQFEY